MNATWIWNAQSTTWNYFWTLWTPIFGNYIISQLIWGMISSKDSKKSTKETKKNSNNYLLRYGTSTMLLCAGISKKTILICPRLSWKRFGKLFSPKEWLYILRSSPISLSSISASKRDLWSSVKSPRGTYPTGTISLPKTSITKKRELGLCYLNNHR